MGERRPWRCRFGFHSWCLHTWGDPEVHGTLTIWRTRSEYRCNDCRATRHSDMPSTSIVTNTETDQAE